MARRFLCISLLLIVCLAALPASAGINDGASFSLDCTGFTGSGGRILLNRDNTGSSREAFIVSATDGAGNIIYEPVVDQFFVGGAVSWTGNDKIEWTSSPQYNPLILRVVSRSGNDFNEQLVALSTGACEGLPSFGALPEGVFLVDGEFISADGDLLPQGFTSPSVGLNQTPPRPSNDEELVQLLPGYLIVNTDNLSLRSGDAPENTLVAIVDGGTRLIPLGHNEDFSWWYVQAGDVIGWAKAEFLIIRGDLSGIGIVPSFGEIAQPRLFLHLDNPIFASPFVGSLPLCTLPGNQEYLVVGRNDDTTWYEVQALCDGAITRGWIAGERGSIRNPGDVFIPVTA